MKRQQLLRESKLKDAGYEVTKNKIDPKENQDHESSVVMMHVLNIDGSLMKMAREKARKLGQTVSIYLSQILSKAISSDSEVPQGTR